MPVDRTKLFISYSEKDKPWLERLLVFLKPLERDGLIERWDEARLGVGVRGRDELRRAVAAARVVVLLVSADFLASDFIEKEVLPPLLAEAEAQGAAVLPLIVSTCLFEETKSLSRFQAVNQISGPLEGMNDSERNKVWTRLARCIHALLVEDGDPHPNPSSRPPAHAPTPPPPAAPPSVATREPAAGAAPASAPGGGRYALLVINDTYDDPLYAGLVAGVSDSLNLEGALTGRDIGGFQVTTLRNVSFRRVQAEIDKFFAGRGPDDLILLYYYGLGVKDAEWGLYFAASDTQRDDPATAIPAYALQKAMRQSRSRRQVVLLDCAYAGAYPPGMAAAECDRRGLPALFQGEGRFVLSASDAVRWAWQKGSEPPPRAAGPADGPPPLAAALVYGLVTGKADRDGNRKITIEELFRFVEEAVAAAAPGQVPVRWAFDQSKADLVIAESALPGEDHRPTPIARRYSVVQDIRQPILDLTVPTYIMDRYFYLLDWNPAFDEVIAKPLKLVRGQDHAKAFVQAMANCEEVVRHAKEVFGGERHPLVDTEILVFHSDRYGEVQFRKVAAQITDAAGALRGWSVSLNVVDPGCGDGLWPDVLARIEEEVGWSRYAVVYDTLLLEFPEYLDLIALVADGVGGARRCLDLGAGTGNGAIRLLETDPNREVWAVELNETMLRHFRAKLAASGRDYADHLTIIKDNILRLDGLPRASFDGAIMTNVLYAVHDRRECLRNVNRVLKRGGVLSLSTPHRDTDVRRLFDRLQEVLEAKGLFDQYQEQFDAALTRHEAMDELIHRDTVEDTLGHLHDAGFTVEEEPRDQYVGAVVVIKAVKTGEPAARVVVPAGPADVVAALEGRAAAEPAPSPAPARAPTGVRDVFVSYSREDQPIAEAIRAHLEDQAIPCWIDTRDLRVGANWPAAIVQAIDRSRVLVLVISPHGNKSTQAPREVARAAERGIPIIPFRAEDVPPSDTLAYYLSNVHWLDAFPPPLERHLPRLAETIKALLSNLAGAAAEAEA
jgi:ubiquinone/menaquinone biosynthesis C-methylase UbiE